jgi:ABC-2 type transport system permease protein
MNTGEIPETINLWDSVFFPVMEILGIAFIGAVPLVTMRVFSEERARGTDELLFTTHLTPFRIAIAKFSVTFAFVILMVAVSFIYPATAISRSGLGAQHLSAVFIGLTLHGIAVASIGLMCSAFTSSQLVASVTAWVIAFVCWDFGWIHPLSNESTAGILDALALRPRYSGFAEGIISLADIAYFIALVAVAMAVARFSFDLRRIQP